MTTKLSSVFKSWPHGTIASTRWFSRMGIQRGSLASYRQSGWIKAVGHGAFTRSDDANLDWTGAVYALQNQYNYDLHPGAQSALELRGLSHYVRLGTNSVFLLTSNKHKNFIPSWFHTFETDKVKFQFVQVSIFEDGFADLVDYKPANTVFSIRISSIEQALLEMLSLVNNKIDLDESFKIFENVRSIDAAKMSLLLAKCTSVKAKRLCMVMATRFQMPWLKNLDTQNVDFGSGSRSLVYGGHFDKKYSITVPKEWYDTIFPEV